MRRLSLWILIVIGVSTACLGYLAHSMTAGIRFLGGEGVVWQQDSYDCGPAVMQMIFSHFQIDSDYRELRERLGTNAAGTSMLRLKRAAEVRGLRCSGWRLSTRDLTEVPLPAILFVRRNHFVVLDAYLHPGTLLVRDPSRGRLQITAQKLGSIWGGEALLFSRPGTGEKPDARWFGSKASAQGPR